MACIDHSLRGSPDNSNIGPLSQQLKYRTLFAGRAFQKMCVPSKDTASNKHSHTCKYTAKHTRSDPSSLCPHTDHIRPASRSPRLSLQLRQCLFSLRSSRSWLCSWGLWFPLQRPASFAQYRMPAWWSDWPSTGMHLLDRRRCLESMNTHHQSP